MKTPFEKVYVFHSQISTGISLLCKSLIYGTHGKGPMWIPLEESSGGSGSSGLESFNLKI